MGVCQTPVARSRVREARTKHDTTIQNLFMSVADHLSQDRNVSIEAVPGAGKTRLMVELCRDGVPSLILAYNRELASRVSLTLSESELAVSASTLCLTFHSLCSRCLAVARDDHELLKVVTEAEQGHLLPEDVPQVARLFIDEAQDVRELYVRLLRVLCLTDVQIVVAGDRNQLVYDFDEDFPATLQTLQSPAAMFGGGHRAWHRVDMDTSHRLTKPVCKFVNSVFNTSIRSARDGPNVEVRVPRSMYSQLHSSLSDVLKDSSDVLILVPYKHKNRVLRNLLNTLSRSGEDVHVHGVTRVDTLDSSKIKCGTFWSAKGLEADTVVVLLPGSAAFNPTYVALTRALRRLIVVIDPRDPHPMVSRVAHQLTDSVDVAMTPATARVLHSGSHIEDPERVSFLKRQKAQVQGIRCLDRFKPKQQLVDDVIGFSVHDIFSSPTTNRDSTLGTLAVLMGLLKAEFMAKRVIRAVQDIQSPTRLEYEKTNEAIRLGVAARIVPRFVTDDELLAPDLRAVMESAYQDPSNISNLANLALAVASWDSWDCVMRSMQPTKDWAEELADTVDFVTEMIPDGARYDLHLFDSEKTRFARVQAVTTETAYYIVWEMTSADMGHSLVLAALHSAGNCLVLQVSTEETFQVYVPPESVSRVLDDPSSDES